MITWQAITVVEVSGACVMAAMLFVGWVVYLNAKRRRLDELRNGSRVGLRIMYERSNEAIPADPAAKMVSVKLSKCAGDDLR